MNYDYKGYVYTTTDPSSRGKGSKYVCHHEDFGWCGVYTSIHKEMKSRIDAKIKQLSK